MTHLQAQGLQLLDDIFIWLLITICHQCINDVAGCCGCAASCINTACADCAAACHLPVARLTVSHVAVQWQSGKAHCKQQDVHQSTWPVGGCMG
jgi:hypothetical protein